MTFKQFLAKRSMTYDAKGDFVRLALADLGLPEATHWEEIRSYFVVRHGHQDFVEAGESVWREYSDLVRRKERQSKA